MNMKRFPKQVAVAAGFIFLCAASAMTLAQSAPPPGAVILKPDQPRSHSAKNAAPEDDFAGLDYTDEQKTEMAKIREDAKAHKDVVAKDTKLNPDQKEAMILGYTRMEYGALYKVLTPEQRRQVEKRNRARRAAEHKAQNTSMTK